MKYPNTRMVLTASLLIGLTAVAGASPDGEPATDAERKELQARLEVAYDKAMLAADQERLAAEASLEKAREQLRLASEQRELSAMQSEEARARLEAEMSKMHEELNNAHRQLQQTTREIARVNREVARARSGRPASSYAFRTSERPVIGVILGEGSAKGVEVLGVSPDGPSDRAGIKQGDVIIAIGGRLLGEINDSGDARDGLRIAMHDVEADTPLIIAVERDDQVLDMTVVPEVREPLSWQSVVRFPTAPSAPATQVAPNAPDAPQAPVRDVTVERIVVPEIDSVEMTAQIEQMRQDIEKRRALREVTRVTPAEGQWEIELHEFSELGNSALQDANVWFGLPMTRGLQLAEIDPGLGEYFKTDRGVLVLKARTDNDLQLESGDVILQVGETPVNSPAEFMRALRVINSGDELVMDIKRHRKDRKLKAVMPEGRTSFYFPGEGQGYTYTFTFSP